MKDKMKKLITIPHLNFALIAIIFGVVMYSLFAPTVPATYDKPMIQDASNIRAGQALTYKIHTCRFVGESVRTDITRQLVSTTNPELTPINLSTDTVSNPSGCRDTTKTVIVPFSTPTGTYQLVIKGIYSTVPLRQPIVVSATSDSFNLLPADDTALEAALELLRQGGTPNGTPVEGSDSTSTTPKTQSNNTTNNSTTNNNSNNSSSNNNGQGSGSAPAPTGLIPGLLNALGGGGIKITL